MRWPHTPPVKTSYYPAGNKLSQVLSSIERVFEKAVEIIREGRGQHFDPDMVEAFMAVDAEFNDIAERFGDGEEYVRAKDKII